MISSFLYSKVFTKRQIKYDPPHEKTNNLHMQKQRRRSASR